LPDEIMSKPDGIQTFAFASMKYQLERDSEERKSLNQMMGSGR